MVTFTCGETYIFDLDQPIQVRYQQLFPKFAPLIRQYCKVWLEFSQPDQDNLNQLEQLLKVHPDRELMEFCYIIGELCGIDAKIILYMQYMYDLGFDDSLSMGCTSILVSPKGQKPYLVRNLDWDFNDIIRGLTINAIYVKNGKVIMTHLSIVAQLLIPHTIKNNQIAISLNFLWPEHTLKQQWNYILNYSNIPSIGRLIYQLSISNYNYSELLQILTNKQVQHHGLLNVIGNQEMQCSIFYINDLTKANKYQLQQEITNDQQFIFTTNGDYFEFSVERYKAAEQNLKQLTSQQLYDPQQVVEKAALQYPNYNETTILTTVLDCKPQESFQIIIK